jgi:hypothetical protein
VKRYFVFVFLFVLMVATISEAQSTFPWRRFFRLPPEVRGLPQRVATLETDLGAAEARIGVLETENTQLKARIDALEQGNVNTEFETLMVLGAMSAAIIGVEAGQLLHADMIDMVNSYTPGVSVVKINGEPELWTQDHENYWQSRADTLEEAYNYVVDYTTEYRAKMATISGQDYQDLLAMVRAMIAEAVANFDGLLLPNE